jgi:hypothetical protein
MTDKINPENGPEKILLPKVGLTGVSLNSYDQSYIIDLLELYSKKMGAANSRQIKNGFIELEKKLSKNTSGKGNAPSEKMIAFIDQQTEDSHYIREEITFIKSDIGHIKDKQILLEGKQKDINARVGIVEANVKLPISFDRRIHGMETKVGWMFAAGSLFNILLVTLLFWMHSKGWV